MLKFHNASHSYQYIGVGIFIVQLFIFLLGLPQFQELSLFRSDPQMVAYSYISTLSALWLALGFYKQFLSIERPVHPIIYLMLAWAAFQFISLPFADSAFGSWFGIPYNGEGGGFYLMLTFSFLIALPLWENKTNRKFIFIPATIALCIILYLQFNPRVFCPKLDNHLDENDTPYEVPDTIAFIIGWIWIAFASSPTLRNKNAYYWLMLLTSVGVIITENATAGFLFSPSIIVSSLAALSYLCKTRFRKLFYVGKIWRTLAVLGIIIPFTWSALSQNPDFIHCKETSIAQRFEFNQISISALIHEPMRFIIGDGWHSFEKDTFCYGMVEGLYSFKKGEYKPNNQWLNLPVHHTHNTPLMILESLGILGFLLFMAIPIFAILNLRRSSFWWCAPMIIAITALSHLWFIFPPSLPFYALSLASLCATRPAKIRENFIFPKWFSLITILMSLIFFASNLEYSKLQEYGTKLRIMVQNESPEQEGITNYLAQDIKHGDNRLTRYLLLYTSQFSDEQNIANQADRDWIKKLMEVIHIGATTPKASVLYSVLEVKVPIMILKLKNDSLLTDLKPEMREILPNAVINLSAKAPMREDIAAYFFEHLSEFTDGNINKQREILEKILTVAPNHRTALWLLGNLYIKSANITEQEKGSEMMARAKKLGVDRVFPIFN